MTECSCNALKNLELEIVSVWSQLCWEIILLFCLCFQPDKDDQVLSIQFSWKGSVKPIGSTFIGVSPEFEFALYTVIFLLAEERVTRETVKIEEYELQVVVCRHGHHIGTAYPVLLGTSSEG